MNFHLAMEYGQMKTFTLEGTFTLEDMYIPSCTYMYIPSFASFRATSSPFFQCVVTSFSTCSTSQSSK